MNERNFPDKSDQNYVLWLVSWFPGRTDPFNGDFIERHARAASAFVPVKIIFVEKDVTLKAGRVVIEKENDPDMEIIRAYYNVKTGIGSSLFSLLKYYSIQKHIFQSVVKIDGLPDLLHVHVAFKAGLLALHVKKKFGIPYLVSEHWSAYYKKSPNSIQHSGFWKRYLIKKVLRGAELILPVAEKLGQAIAQFCNTPQKVVPNVVNTKVFFCKQQSSGAPVFVHASTMNYYKNPEGILQAAYDLHAEGVDFKLVMIGRFTPQLEEMARRSGSLDSFIFFKNEIPYFEVAKEMQAATAFILFSRFESLPCVILEAQCCGLPVIASNVGGISEVVTLENGILVESENVKQLKEAMRFMVGNHQSFDKEKISSTARARFGFEETGRQIAAIYDTCLNNKEKG